MTSKGKKAPLELSIRQAQQWYADQNNSSVDNDSQVERLSKTNPGPKAKLPAAGAKISDIEKLNDPEKRKRWVGKQQELWKTEFENTTFIERGKNNDELPF